MTFQKTDLKTIADAFEMEQWQAEEMCLSIELGEICEARWAELGDYAAWTESSEGLILNNPRARQVGVLINRTSGPQGIEHVKRLKSHQYAWRNPGLAIAFEIEIEKVWAGIAS